MQIYRKWLEATADIGVMVYRNKEWSFELSESLSLSLSLLHTNIAELQSVYQDELFFKVKKNNKFIGLESPLLLWPPFFPEFFK